MADISFLPDFFLKLSEVSAIYILSVLTYCCSLINIVIHATYLLAFSLFSCFSLPPKSIQTVSHLNILWNVRLSMYFITQLCILPLWITMLPYFHFIALVPILYNEVIFQNCSLQQFHSIVITVQHLLLYTLYPSEIIKYSFRKYTQVLQ